jgi:integrase/recombinase XerD
MKRLSTKVHLFKKDFNAQGKHGYWVRSSDKHSAQKNYELKSLMYKAEQAIRDLEGKGTIVTLNNLASYLLGVRTVSNNSYLGYFNKIIGQLKEMRKVNTWKKYKTTYRKLQKHLKGRDLSFSEFTTSLLFDFERSLKTEGKKLNTINKELKVLRAVLYRAIKEDLVIYTKNPFFGFPMKTGKTKKAKLTQDEIESLERLILNQTPILAHCRDYFLFSFYCFGIRFADFCELKWSNISNDRLNYQMGKTDVYKSVPLHTKSKQILEVYREKMNKTDYIFPLLDREYKDPFKLKNKISSQNAIVNKNLKEIAKLAGIEKIISFHIARHSFADIARTKGANLYAISKSLGHSNLNITEKYLNSMDQDSVDNEVLSKVFI